MSFTEVADFVVAAVAVAGAVVVEATVAAAFAIESVVVAIAAPWPVAVLGAGRALEVEPEWEQGCGDEVVGHCQYHDCCSLAAPELQAEHQAGHQLREQDC